MHLSTFTEFQKKIAVIWLMAGSCIAALLLLLFLPTERQPGLDNLAEADSLILQELALFNISPDNIRTRNFTVTDQFTRKSYVVDLPVQVSMTHLHAELIKQLRPLGISTIGYVNVPDQEMAIQLLYRDKVIRTLALRTDPDYIRIPHPASLLVYFDRRPTASLIHRILELGVPVEIVFRSASRRSLVRWAEALPDELPGIGIWFDDARTAYDEPVSNPSALLRTLEEIAHIQERPMILDFSSLESGFSQEQQERLGSMNISVINAENFRILSSENRYEFDREMLNYSRLARQAGGPKILVRATDRTLDWLEEWIPRIKRGGVVFVSI